MKKNLIPAIVILIVIVTFGFIAFRFRSSLPFLKNSVLTIPEKKREVTWPGLSNEGRVLFVSPPYGLAFGDSNGANLSKFNEAIDGQELIVRDYKVSPDSLRVALGTMPRASSVSAQLAFYSASLDGSNLKKLVLPEHLESGAVVRGFIWSKDSKSVVFVSSISSKNTAVANRFLKYDLESGAVSELYKESAKSITVNSFDPELNRLIFSTEMGSYIVDLTTKTKTTLPRIFSNQLNGDGSVLAGVSKSVVSLYKTTEVSSETPAKIDFSDLGDRVFVNLISWSTKCDYLVISFIDSVNNKSISRIYKKSGERVSTVDFEVQEGSIFSSDNSSLLAVRYAGKSDAGFYQTAWQEFDALTGKSLTGSTTTSDLSFAVFWF